MKKTIFILLILTSFFSSCIVSNDPDTKSSYTFVTTQKITCSPSVAGYPKTTTAVTTMNGITEAEAKEAAAKLTYTSKSTTGGYTITITQTCTYVLTKDYVPSTGTRIVT